MHRKIYLLILAAILPCLVFAATLTVKQDSSGDYTSIQAALDAADPGDTVLVYPGRYYENLTIETNDINLMSLEGTSGDPAYIDSTVIDGTNSIGGIIVGQFKIDINIRGFSITNGIGAGIALGASSESIVSNCKIFRRTSTYGGGVNIGGATVHLSGVDIYDNYAINLGGGLYASRPSGYTHSITFDPVNRCSIYNNRSGSGQDIYIQHATDDLYMPLDTFSIAEPNNYHAVYLSDNPLTSHYQINFDILNAHHQEIDSDLYVSTTGDDANDGLSPATALKTIHEGIYRIASDSLCQKTVHILPGEYSRTDNDQIFPIALKSWVKVQGSGIDTTIVIGEPHPLIYENVSTTIFSANRVPSFYLSDLSITARNINHYCGAIRGPLRNSNMNLSNLRIHDISSSDSFTGDYSLVYLGATGEKESNWDNVTIENIGPADVGMIEITSSITENGEVSAFNGNFTECTFRNAVNNFTSPNVWAWPLIYITGDKKLLFDNCIFDNLSMHDDDGYAIAIGTVQFPQQQNHYGFHNCLFSNISTHNDMIYFGSSNNPRIDISNCTFAGNQGDAYTLMVNGEVNIVNSIFDNDTPYQIKVNPMDGNPNEHTNISIDHSLVKDGIAGILPFPVPGNTIDFLPSSISGDPLFAGGFDIHDPLYYSLSEYSPCIDAGTPDLTGLGLPPYDLAGNYRVWNSRIDMGCFEYGSEPWVSNDDPVLPEPVQLTLHQNYPNPFNPETTIRFDLAKPGPVTIDVFNIKGQKMKALVNDSFIAGQHSIIWNGTDSKGKPVASGVYFYRMTTPKSTLIHKMLLMK
ncbi:MAG: T9SS type A sorting domain-containing protein [Candidatus Cloacimonetes bacterium]|nr:T9SS type A sorting domain-containing protein [Candidatus Cloacimonadota bacterium]MDD3563314.1 T9SS type A sorting domain-containing protein [Candidatus Cloacimonadota bacterium]MDD4277718.1 T9SS type A sorting domain-containing protein [Candidatus Cloacimonadota bacterium]